MFYALPENGDGDLLAHRSFGNHGWQVADAFDRLVVEGDDHVTAPDPCLFSRARRYNVSHKGPFPVL